MKAVVLTKYGDIQGLVYRDCPEPALSPGGLLVRVHAAGLNFGDILIRQGYHKDSPRPPAVHGMEVSGVVEAVAAGVDGFKPGDRVCAFLPGHGGFAEKVVCVPPLTQILPDEFTFVEGAAFPVNFLTASLLLHTQAHVAAGESILLRPAGGGVGLALLQLGRRAGARVFCVAGPSKHERLLALGAEACFAHTDDWETAARRAVGGDGFDIVFDSVGGGDLRRSYRLLAPFGRLGLFGASSFVAHRKFQFFKSLVTLLRFPVFWPLELMNSTRTVFGLGLLRRPASDPRLRDALAESARLWREGHLHPLVDSVYPLARIGDAQRRLEERKNFGKVVLAVSPSVSVSFPSV